MAFYNRPNIARQIHKILSINRSFLSFIERSQLTTFSRLQVPVRTQPTNPDRLLARLTRTLCWAVTGAANRPFHLSSAPRRKMVNFPLQHLEQATARTNSAIWEEVQEAAEESKGEISANKTTHLTSQEGQRRQAISHLQSCVSPGFLVMLLGELRNNCRKPQGRRWSEIEKTLAASMFHKSRRLYNFLRRFVSLPTRKTLSKFTRKASFRPGINAAVIQLLTKMAGKMNTAETESVLIMDEVSLTRRYTSVSYTHLRAPRD